jgi:hypothetical protein
MGRSIQVLPLVILLSVFTARFEQQIQEQGVTALLLFKRSAREIGRKMRELALTFPHPARAGDMPLIRQCRKGSDNRA